MGCKIRGPFAKFVVSPYYSESELCGGAVTVSFSKYLPWQAVHFLQRSTHFSKTCCRLLITNFLPRSSLFMAGKVQQSHGARSELNSVFGLEKVDRWNPIRTSAIQSRAHWYPLDRGLGGPLGPYLEMVQLFSLLICLKCLKYIEL
jgi:hypothetical protein